VSDSLPAELREASRRAEREVVAERWDHCACWDDEELKHCSAPQHAALKARAKAARLAALAHVCDVLHESLPTARPSDVDALVWMLRGGRHD
jgi:hypothetical protein